MMSPTNLCLLLCLSVHYVTSASSEVNNEEIVEYVRKDLNNLHSLLDESNNRNALDENVNLEKTVDNNNLLNSLSSSNLLNKLNVQVHSSDLDDTNSLRNLRSNLKSVNGVYDFPNPLNYLDNVNLLSNAHGLEGVNNPVEVRSAVVNRNGQNLYEDGSSLSALLALNRLGVTSNRVGGLAGLNVLARNGVSSSVDLNGLDNVNLRTTYELNRLNGNRRNNLELNNLELNGYLNQLSDSDSLNTVERNNLDELADDLLGDKSTQVLSASLNKLKEDNRRGLLKPVKLAKEQLLGRSGSGLDEDNLLNALESHNEGELNALSALATISNLNDNDYQNNLKSSKSLLESNNLVNNAVEVSSVESEADNLNELENLHKTPDSLLNEADSSELESRYPEEEVNEVNTRRSGYLNNEFLNNLRLLYGRNRGLGGSAQLLPYSRPVSNNPYEYYNNLPLNPYLLNNQRNVGVSPYMLRGRSSLKTNNNLNEDEELSTGLVEDKDSNDNDENRRDNLEELQDYNVDNLLESLNNDRLNGLPLGKNSVLLRNSQKQNQGNVNDFENRVTLPDTNNLNDLSLVDVETLSGRRMGPFETLNPNLGVNANDANVLGNLGNLNSLRRKNEKNSDLSPVGLNKNSARDKLAKLHAVLRLTEEEELTLDEAKQLLAKGLRRPERRHF